MKTSQLRFYLATLCVILFLLVDVSMSAQTKKEVQFSLDTLVKSNNKLKEDMKSMKEEWKKHNNFFEHVKGSFFDPIDINSSIDSGIVKFNEINEVSTAELHRLTKSNKELNDSLTEITKSIKDLESEKRVYKQLLLSSINHASFPQVENEFNGTWNLFLNPIQLSGEPYESGLIGFNPFIPNDSLRTHHIYKIDFDEEEIATIHFSNGQSQKSFYSIKNFSTNSPYSIKFSKNEDFKLTMLISPLPSGLAVSYEVPIKSEKVYYYYGLMKK